jgi:hypothetical protein
MYPYQEPGVRKLISAEDALVDAQISQFSGDLNLNPDAVPEPGSLGLMACGVLGAAGWHWARCKRRRQGLPPTRRAEPEGWLPDRGGGEVAASPAARQPPHRPDNARAPGLRTRVVVLA